MKKILAIVLLITFLGPPAGLVSVAVLVNPAARSCESGSLIVSDIPDSLTARTRSGETLTLNRRQLTHAGTITTIGSQTAGVGRDGVIIALMAALTESGLRILANSGVYPESIGFPNDGDGSDHDSLGLFQMRPASGWGTVAELMDPRYQARAFFGGASGPNGGSPQGLLDIAGWQQLERGAAAQAVEVSAFPDRYREYEPVAERILAALTDTRSAGDAHGGLPRVPETTRVVFPLPEGTYTNTDSFGPRVDPYTGEYRFHAGSDLAAPSGTPILAIADGRVVFAGDRGTYGGLIILEHTIGGQRVASYYAHMYDTGIHVTAGDSVAAGQHIGDVGSAGKSTGPHLHLEIHPGGQDHPAVDALAWLTEHGAAAVGDAAVNLAGCRPEGIR
ncbi:peptidoglycan DD-metalloendopeptidase family protein [Agromyces endophyticus]|uniref:M23 family metallopeptidase n=1 Tax=Agromyces sp. H17E-10 TaxID=2932244 RepID=UPI001FD2D4D3|nr:M23 family metallopeptidase [Agromyces sp. H17E-10]UOQ89194.1 peptidoglycan DD-metalloendopeptidase family protein [Agromyces sp. H17E-10]